MNGLHWYPSLWIRTTITLGFVGTLFVLVCMQLRNHVNTYIGSKAFQAL